jgi:hypothetical protein
MGSTSQLGVPERFRPRIDLYWYGRGENASRERRVELRRVATTRLVELERAEIERIDARYRQFATAVLSAAIGTAEARKLLATMPTAEQLSQSSLDYKRVTEALLEGPEPAALHGRQALLTDGNGEDRT